MHAIKERHKIEPLQGRIAIHIITRVPQEVLKGVDRSINKIRDLLIAIMELVQRISI